MISVLICTYNRARSLLETLQSLAKMEVPAGLSWELIVVDNNSTDSTREVVEEFAKASGIEVRYIFEGRRGKSYALNTGVQESRGGIIAIIDDDIHPQADWLAVIQREFSTDPALGVLSGRVELLNPADLPISIRRGAVRAEFKSLNDATCLMAGCNFAARRIALESVNLFDTDLGPGQRWYGEDADFFYRAWKAGSKLIYEPAMLVFHNHGRQGPEAERSLMRAYNMGAGAIYAKHAVSGDIFAAKLMYWILDGRGRELLRGTDIARNFRNTLWLVAGFAGYSACQCWRRVWK